MEVGQRELVTVVHGMLFGGFFLMAIFGALVMLLEWASPHAAQAVSRWQAIYLTAMVVAGWAAVLTGAYLVYPWYRAVAPAGADLALYPKALLVSHPYTAGWHNFGMEWKEHIAWIAPMAMTMVAFVMVRYRALWQADSQVRRAVLGFAAAAFMPQPLQVAGER
jgi:hypothetical protein